MYLSSCSFHNQLKSIHLNGKVNRRVDCLIHYLLQYEKDAFFRYKRDRQLPSVMNRKMKLEMSRHQQGLQIPTGKVHVSSCVPIVAMNKINVHFHAIGIPIGKRGTGMACRECIRVQSWWIHGCLQVHHMPRMLTPVPTWWCDMHRSWMPVSLPSHVHLWQEVLRLQQWAYLHAHPQDAFSSS